MAKKMASDQGGDERALSAAKRGGRPRSAGEGAKRSATAARRDGTARRRLSAAERRGRILDAATGLFAARGYAGAPIDGIARAAGVSPPVLYDHFPSKLALYEAVLDGHFANLRAIWDRFPATELSTDSVTASVDAWFAYVEANPDAARILFREPGEADPAAVHREVTGRSRALVLRPLLGIPAGAPLTETGPDLEMTWVVLRGVLQGLALWWVDHPDVPRDRVVATAITSLWTGWGSFLGGA
jgi:AcrR family transcriptional regulator